MFTFQRCKTALLAVMGAGMLAAMPAHAATYALKAAPYVESLPNGGTVTMWGYRAWSIASPADVTNGMRGATTGFTSPGPALVVPPGDTTLTVVLINGLPNNLPTSLVVHGLVNGGNPVFATAADASGTVCTAVDRSCRLRSLAQEAPNGGEATYTFDVKPGTYLYQSGTHQQVQVQMGLYGMLTHDAQAGGASRFAYGADTALMVPFNDDDLTRLVFSEVDVAMHDAVTAGTFGGSTLNYHPTVYRLHRYLANNQPRLLSHPAGGASNQTIQLARNQQQLVRMVNAGQTSRSIGLAGRHLQLVAEDGKPYPYPRDQVVALMPAFKTMDAMVVTSLPNWNLQTTERDIVLFDRRGGFSMAADGRVNGDYLRIRVDDGTNEPVLDMAGVNTTGLQGDAYIGALSVNGGTGPFTYSLLAAPTGMTIDPATGVLSWTPSNEQAQRPAAPDIQNTLTARVVDATGRSDTATTYIAVTNVNDAPVAANDTVNVVGGLITLPVGQGLMVNDADPDGDVLSGATVASGLAPAARATADAFTLNTDGSLTYDVRNQTWFRDIGINGQRLVTFTYTASDGVAASVPATVTLVVHGHQAPVAVDDSASYVRNAAHDWIEIPVLSNDQVEAGWTIDPGTLIRAGGAPSRGGQAQAVEAGTGGTACGTGSTNCVIRYRPATTQVPGSETFQYRVRDNFGRLSNLGTVTVNVQ